MIGSSVYRRLQTSIRMEKFHFLAHYINWPELSGHQTSPEGKTHIRVNTNAGEKQRARENFNSRFAHIGKVGSEESAPIISYA